MLYTKMLTYFQEKKFVIQLKYQKCKITIVRLIKNKKNLLT